jgi:hypothetical protein
MMLPAFVSPRKRSKKGFEYGLCVLITAMTCDVLFAEWSLPRVLVLVLVPYVLDCATTFSA